MRILVLDNYDSFTYNLVHILEKLGYGESTDVIRNDKIEIGKVNQYDRILLSPGPGIPSEAGSMKEIIEMYSPKKSILGVCLGHQGIAEVFGAELLNMPKVLHGIKGTVLITDRNERLFRNIPDSFHAAHYHSWVVDDTTVNGDIIITAKDPTGLVMGIRHKTYDIHGIQFHPESILTDHGEMIIENWLKEEK